MKIETKFNLGDEVYFINQGHKVKYIECDSCDGTGKIELKNKNLVECITCNGKGILTSNSYNYFRVGTSILIIGKVMIDFSTRDNIDEFNESYMCRETGIGSGTIWPVKKLFSTREEAQAAADKLNFEEEHIFKCNKCNNIPNKYHGDSQDYRHCPVHNNTMHTKFLKGEDK